MGLACKLHSNRGVVVYHDSNSEKNKLSPEIFRIIVSPLSIFKEDSIILSIGYENNGNDTLFLPIEYLSDKNVMELEFLDSTPNTKKPCCGQYSKYDFSHYSGKCNEVRLLTIPPKNVKYLKFNVEEDLGYIGFEKNYKYKFRVLLHVDSGFTNICGKIWIDSKASNIGELMIF